MATFQPSTSHEGVVTPVISETDEKRIGERVHDATEDVPREIKDFPLCWKITALICGVMLSWGSSFSENTLGPLKKTLIKELDINNAQYGAISSATSLVNTILPIIGGYGLDYYGVEWGSMVCSVFIFIGAIVSAAGSNQDTFGLVVGGRVIMGFGSTVIEMCTSKVGDVVFYGILCQTNKVRSLHIGSNIVALGLVYGLDLSIGKLIVLIAKATAVPMRDATSFCGWALWIPAIVCFANLLQNIFYVWWARGRPEWTRMPTGQMSKLLQKQEPEQVLNESPARQRKGFLRAIPDWRVLGRIPWFFWLIACSQILQAGVVGGFNGLNADIITETRGSTEQIAGYTSAVQQVIPVVCAPLVGAYFDFFGYRMVFVSITSAIWILVYCLIGYTPNTNALGAMVIASVASTMNALPFLASIPLMVPNQVQLGLALGIWKAFNNSGSVVVDMIAGRLQDITSNGTYERVIAFFVAVKALEFCLGLFYGILDRRYLAGILTLSEKKRMKIESEGKLGNPSGRKPARNFTIVGISLLTSLIIIAWVLFIKYSI